MRIFLALLIIVGAIALIVGINSDDVQRVRVCKITDGTGVHNIYDVETTAGTYHISKGDEKYYDLIKEGGTYNFTVHGQVFSDDFLKKAPEPIESRLVASQCPK